MCVGGGLMELEDNWLGAVRQWIGANQNEFLVNLSTEALSIFATVVLIGSATNWLLKRRAKQDQSREDYEVAADFLTVIGYWLKRAGARLPEIQGVYLYQWNETWTLFSGALYLANLKDFDEGDKGRYTLEELVAWEEKTREEERLTDIAAAFEESEAGAEFRRQLEQFSEHMSFVLTFSRSQLLIASNMVDTISSKMHFVSSGASVWLKEIIAEFLRPWQETLSVWRQIQLMLEAQLNAINAKRPLRSILFDHRLTIPDPDFHIAWIIQYGLAASEILDCYEKRAKSFGKELSKEDEEFVNAARVFISSLSEASAEIQKIRADNDLPPISGPVTRRTREGAQPIGDSEVIIQQLTALFVDNSFSSKKAENYTNASIAGAVQTAPTVNADNKIQFKARPIRQKKGKRKLF